MSGEAATSEAVDPGLMKTSSSAREASRGSAIRLIAEVVVRLSSIVATLWLTRSLGVATFGVFLLVLSIGLMIAELCDLGLNAIVVPSIVRSHGNLRTLFRLKAIMTGGVLAMGVLLIPLVSFISGFAPGLLVLCSIHFLGASWIEMTGTALRALGRRLEEALLLFAFRFTLVSLILGAPFGVSILGASLAYAMAVGPALCLGAALIGGALKKAEEPGTDIRAILRQAAPMGANGYLAILSTRVELFLLQAFYGEHAVGLFGGAVRIVESLLTFPAAIAGGALPSLSKDVVEGSKGAAQRTFGLVVWLGVPSALGLALCAPEILKILGPGFVDAAPALRVLAGAMLLCFANAALLHVLIGAGETLVIPWLTVFRVGIAAVAGIVLVPLAGLLGAAASFTLAELCLFYVLIQRVGQHSHLEVARPVGWALVSCLPMVVVLSAWSAPLPLAIATGASLFVLSAALVLKQGTEASGLA